MNDTPDTVDWFAQSPFERIEAWLSSYPGDDSGNDPPLLPPKDGGWHSGALPGCFGHIADKTLSGRGSAILRRIGITREQVRQLTRPTMESLGLTPEFVRDSLGFLQEQSNPAVEPELRCPVHPTYRAIRRPRCHCVACWAIYCDKHQISMLRQTEQEEAV